MDLSASESRETEYAPEVSTCVVPNHQVYSTLLERTLTSTELLGVQGIWEQDAANKEAFQNLCHGPGLRRKQFHVHSLSGRVLDVPVHARKRHEC